MAVTGRTDGPLAGVLHSTQVGRAPKARAMRTSFLLGVLLFSACKTTPEAPKTAEAPAVLVRLERTACFGRCPIYRVTVMSDGAVSFVGERFVVAEGEQKATLDAEALKKLVTRLEASPFASWNDFVDRSMTDMPSVVLTFKGKTVHHYLGDERAPAELKQLEDDVDALIGTAPWVTGQGGPAL